jgi:PPIC-type PPIASE domain
MMQRVLVCLLLGSLSWGQAVNPTPAAAPQAPAAPSSEAKSPDAPTVPLDTPVITIEGMCEAPAAGNPTDAGCKTVITRADFEQILAVVGTNMPAAARRQLATRYANALVMSQKAHAMGLDQGPKYEELVKLQKLTVSATLVTQAIQQKASEVSDKEVEDYYNKNQEAYQEVSFERLFVPRTKQLDTPKIKLADAANQKRQDDAAAAMKKEADTLQVRAVAGEDFAKLQIEAYTVAGLKSTPPSQKLSKARRNSLPPAQASVFDLKANQVSPVIADMSGYFVYKVVEKDTLPLSQVHDEIFGSLKSEKVQEAMQALQRSGTPQLNDEYFGPASPQGNMPPPSAGPRPGAKPPSLGPK